MKTLRYSLLLAALCSYESVAAIGINSMVEFAHEGEGTFTITNGEDFRQFISVAVSSIKIEDGELVKTPYTRENIDSWSLTVRPARTIIDAKLSKDFKVNYKPLASEPKDRDKMYQLTFIPTPYFAKGEPAKHAVQVAIGFAPVFVVPAEKDQPLSYDVTYDGQSIQLNNQGNSYIRAFFDACPASTKGKAREACTKVVYAMSGRRLTVSLPPEMQAASKIKADISTHYLTYKDALTLQKNQTQKR
jgi:P pilus assembly chaperone PapD